MIARFAYRLLAFVLVTLACSNAVAQTCEKNMLDIPDVDSYASVDQPKNTPEGAMTIECWARSSGFSGGGGLVEYGISGDTGQFSLRIEGPPARCVATFRLNVGIVSISSTAITNVSIWHHYAVTFTPNDSIRLYIDGVLNAIVPTTGSAPVGSSNTLYVGRSTILARSFYGDIDEVRIWGRARSGTEIAATMSTPLLGNETGFLLYYRFDDDPLGPVIHNFCGSGDELTLNGSASLIQSTSPVDGSAVPGYMLGSNDTLITFPILDCSDTATTRVKIFNRGPQTIQITPIGFINGGSIFSSSPSGFPISPGDTTLITIQANATKPGTYHATLVVASSTICGGLLQIPVVLIKESVGLQFADSVFHLNTLQDCNLPLIRSTALINTGVKPLTVTSLSFSQPGVIKILSPSLPFTIDTGKTVVVKFEVLSGAAVTINNTLSATTQECSRTASMRFVGIRTTQSFTVPTLLNFPEQHLPPTTILDTMTIMLHNTGASDLYFGPAMQLGFGVPNFRLLSPVTGLADVKPNDSLPIVVQFRSDECGYFQNQLTLHLDDARDCPLDTSITITANVLGPLLTTIADTINLPPGCALRDTTLVFTNHSGRQLTIGIPSFDQSGVMTFQSFGVLPRTLNDGDSVALKFEFSPPEGGEYYTTARLSLSPCGYTAVTFHGINGVGKFVQSDSVLDFGTSCDLAPQTATVQVQNRSGRAIAVTDTISGISNDFSIVDPPLPFTFADGETKTLTIRYAPSAQGLRRGAIRLFDSGCFVTQITAKGVVEHANVVPSQSIIEFGTVCPLDSLFLPLVLHNIGSGSLSIKSASIVAGSAFFVDSSVAGVTMPSGASFPVVIGFIPNDTDQHVGLLEFIFGPCGDTLHVALHGTGGPAPMLMPSDTILDFGELVAGSSDTICFELRNPSCVPIVLDPQSFGLTSGPFSFATEPTEDSLTISNPLSLCFVFSPTIRGTFVVNDTIGTGNNRAIITLKGIARQPQLTMPNILDFGDVLKGSSKTLPLVITNNGDTSTSIAMAVPPSGAFSPVTVISSIGASPATIIDSFMFAPSTYGLQLDTVVLRYTSVFDTVILRGRGTGPGPLFSSSLVDFGDVRLGHNSSVNIIITASGDTITITNISLPGTVFTYHTNLTLPVVLPKDSSLPVTLTYTPIAEVSDTDTLTLSTATTSDVGLEMFGTGVQSHLNVSDSIINFGNVALGAPAASRPFTISNTGGYPLAITSVSLPATVNTITPDPIAQSPVAPHSSQNYTITFLPKRAVAYSDTLTIVADAPETKTTTTILGAGVFAPFGIPQITYTLPQIQARVGDIVDIPIMIGGPDIALVELDSFSFDLRYDPTVVYIMDSVRVLDNFPNGFQYSLSRPAPYRDSVVRVVAKGSRLPAVAGTLCILRGEALLGEHDSTALILAASDPKNSSPLLSSVGSFVVTDCGNYRGGILIKGNYSLAGASPNPTTGIVTIGYELGLPAHVKLSLFDALGRNVRTILDADRGVGSHTFTTDISDLPSGEYLCVIQSLEYRATQKILLAK